MNWEGQRQPWESTQRGKIEVVVEGTKKNLQWETMNS